MESTERWGSPLARVAAGHIAPVTGPGRPTDQPRSPRGGGYASLPRAARRLWWLLTDLSHVARRKPVLTIDVKRVNAELRRASLLELDDDVGYRERVKQRIREGARCTLPPLVERKRRLAFAVLPING